MELDLDFLDTVLEELAGESAPIPAHFVYMGERNGKPHYKVPAVMKPAPEPKPEPKPVEVLRKRLNLDEIHLFPGMICPRCKGSGKSEWGNCYWCTAESKPREYWGILSPKDIMLINSRRESRRAVCDVIAA